MLQDQQQSTNNSIDGATLSMSSKNAWSKSEPQIDCDRLRFVWLLKKRNDQQGVPRLPHLQHYFRNVPGFVLCCATSIFKYSKINNNQPTTQSMALPCRCLLRTLGPNPSPKLTVIDCVCFGYSKKEMTSSEYHACLTYNTTFVMCRALFYAVPLRSLNAPRPTTINQQPNQWPYLLNSFLER